MLKKGQQEVVRADDGHNRYRRGGEHESPTAARQSLWAVPEDLVLMQLALHGNGGRADRQLADQPPCWLRRPTVDPMSTVRDQSRGASGPSAARSQSRHRGRSETATRGFQCSRLTQPDTGYRRRPSGSTPTGYGVLTRMTA